MENVLLIEQHLWYDFLTSQLNEIDIFVPVNKGNYIDYERYNGYSKNIVYNKPLPVTPLKFFVLPFKENVVISKKIHNKKLIIGIPACDLAGLSLLDQIYLDEKFRDNAYQENRENLILIGTDCYSTGTNCHCVQCGIDPYPGSNADIILSDIDNNIILEAVSEKGLELLARIRAKFLTLHVTQGTLDLIAAKRKETKERLRVINTSLPDFDETALLITRSDGREWKRYAESCVSCGACTSVCPTCTCFLLTDRPGFEKVRQQDGCQLPAFEKIAAGEDPLLEKHVRFRNRYLCKYKWKPENFGMNACTGCGRCIDSCPADISKNRIFTELKNEAVPV